MLQRLILCFIIGRKRAKESAKESLAFFVGGIAANYARVNESLNCFALSIILIRDILTNKFIFKPNLFCFLIRCQAREYFFLSFSLMVLSAEAGLEPSTFG
jgi:hypothetical protein